MNEMGDTVSMSHEYLIQYQNLSSSAEDWSIVDRLYPCSTNEYFLNCGTPITAHPSYLTMYKILDQHEHKKKLMNVVMGVVVLAEDHKVA